MLTVQASVGARLNELEALGNTGAQKVLSYVKQLSDLEDVNIYQATSDLLLRQVALQAASLALQRIQGNSLFSMGR
ncbi:flagellar hook-associated protein 3 [Bordetella pertussis]|nr:flagellar hook-associated protein 3 [Bordetella pertussis]CFU81030.1 flagellar hook-associated protein 3 [Bordetella pertussis]CPI03022.1 flagellar hook-associated protein 3 [Bordetella pertussis]CPL10997.1 flagellar hook-associated protein 3 [Bordetella pertussis]CPL70139.1 flagellar hook-associated protein 3 [Bordetella pertussis]